MTAIILISATVNIVFVLSIIFIFKLKHPLSTVVITLGIAALFTAELEFIERKMYEGKVKEYYFDGKEMRVRIK